MSGQVYGDAFAIIPDQILFADVSANAVRLYGIFALHADPTGRAYPGLKRMAELMRVSEDTIRRAKKELVDARLIRVEARFDDAGRQVTDNVYLPNRGRKTATPGGSKAATQTRSIGTRNNNSGWPRKNRGADDQPTWVAPPNFVDDLDTLPEKTVDPMPTTQAISALRLLRRPEVGG